MSAGSGALTLTVNGSGFIANSIVNVGGTAEATTYVSASQLTATVPTSQITSGAELAVTVTSGSFTSSGSVNLEVDNPAPTIASVSPTSEVAGTASALVTVTGTGFDAATIINVNGAARTTAFTSATQVSVTLVASDLASPGSLSLAAANPTPGGGTSTAMSLSVATPVPPTAASISPTSVSAGSGALTLTVNGSGFVAGSVVKVGGTAEATTYVSASQLTATIPGSQLTIGAQLPVTVLNGAVSASGSVTLQVNNPAPMIASVSPTSEASGASSAVVMVSGTGFDPATVVDVNGAARPTAFSSATLVAVTLTTADLASVGNLSLNAANPTPGGGASMAVILSVIIPATTPTITSVSPNTFYSGSPDTMILVGGTGFTASSVVEWNGAPLQTSLVPYSDGYSLVYYLAATAPAADFAAAGTASITVQTPGDSPALSNAASVAITNPPQPTLTSLSPSGGAIRIASQITLQGTGFAQNTTVEINGTAVPTTYSSTTSISATLPASALSLPGNVNVTVTTPAPGGGTSAAQLFTVFLPITANDLVFNQTDGLLYASVPSIAAGASGNVIDGIDPITGTVTRQIQVGSKPNKLALSSDGTQLFVGLDGSASVAQVNLAQGQVVNQFSLGGGQGVYDPPLTALYLAAVPGAPNSVVVATQGGYSAPSTGTTIYDSGVARTNGWRSGEGAMSFGSSASTLYVASNAVEELTIDATGVTSATTLATLAQQATAVQYDNGNLYLSTGQVLNASSGVIQGTFYSGTTTVASGPVVSDSSLGRAFIAPNYFSSNSAGVLAFDESSYNLLGSTAVNGAGENGYGFSFGKIVRWGQNGLALNATPGPFTSQSQIFILQSPLVKDLSSTPADLAVTLSAPAAAATGASASWVATVQNLGPNASQGAAVAITLDSSLIVNSVQQSTGSCGTGASFTCDLGTLASGATVTITVNATPTQAGTLGASALISSVSADPTLSNNAAASTTTVTGGEYGAVPALSAISPNLVQAGSSDFQLTVSGAGFNTASTVNLGSTALTTTFVSTTSLTATVPAAQVSNYGWVPITVTNPSPGGGISPIAPLTIYALVNVPASGLLFDPYGQALYATIPSTATGITGNTVVTINPATGAVGTPVPVGSQPTVMAETADGDYLYVGLSGANSVAKFDLLNQTVAATIPLSLPSGSFAATWLSTMPGTDNTLAVNMPNEGGNFGIFDIDGSTGTFRPNFSGIYNGENPIFADASHIYAYDNQTSGAEFYRYSVDANGLTLIDGTTLNGTGGFGGLLQLANGLVFGSGGGIINPSTTPPSQVATLPLIDFYDSGSTAEGDGFVADPSLGKEFLMLENFAGTLAYGLTRYDLSTYLPEAFLPIPSAYSGTNNSWTMLRWGQDGLALLTATTIYGATDTTTSSVLLLRGPFVTPQELGTATAASLSGSSATALAQGSGNTMLTLTGTSFLPGVAITWNGSYRTTTVLDAQHVTVAIPASDLASAASASLVATNPGAPASNSLTITIN